MNNIFKEITVNTIVLKLQATGLQFQYGIADP